MHVKRCTEKSIVKQTQTKSPQLIISTCTYLHFTDARLKGLGTSLLLRLRSTPVAEAVRSVCSLVRPVAVSVISANRHLVVRVDETKIAPRTSGAMKG